MGVTVSKSEEKVVRKPQSKTMQDFKRVSTRVGKIGVMAREARQRNQLKNGRSSEMSTPDGERTDTTSLSMSDATLGKDLGSARRETRRTSKAHFYDGSDTGHTLVYKDTTDAWAALRAGMVPEDVEDIPDTQISVVDSTLGGYKTVEKTVGGTGHHGSDYDVDSGNDSAFIDSVREHSSKDDGFVIPFADGIKPVGWDHKITSKSKCGICESHTGHEVFPCRICDQVYHEDCLRRRGKLHDGETTAALRAAYTNIGWSCHECENLGQLLSDDEMFELMEIFEKCDVDSDATISLEEFIEYRQVVVREHESRDLTMDEKEDEARHFKHMDTDRTGTLSWWEFLNHEAIRRLATRSKKELVIMLKPKEVQQLRTNFEVFDTDGDGCVTEYEARRAFKNWFSRFVEDPSEMSPRAQRRIGSQSSLRNMASELASHVHTNTGMMMGADTDRSGSVSWEEYLMEQALYTLAVRPNVGPVRINRRPTFCSL